MILQQLTKQLLHSKLSYQLKNNILYGHKILQLNCGLMMGNMNTGAYRGGPALIFFDDFTTYANTTEGDAAWPTSDTGQNRVNPTNDNIDCGFLTDNTNNAISHDLQDEIGGGNFVSDTAWVFQYTIRFDSLDNSAQANFHAGLMSLDSSNDSDQLHDYLGMQTAGGSGNETYGAQEKDGQALGGEGAQNDVALVWATATDYFFREIRLTSTTFIIERHADGTFSSVSDSAAGTCPSTIVDLRHVKFTNVKQGGSGDFQGTIDNVSVFDGVTSV